MSIIFVILPLTLVLSLGAVSAFTWATRSGQFDDLQTPALRALHDSPPEPSSPRASDEGVTTPNDRRVARSPASSCES